MRLVLHVGLPKTGSTHLQAQLFGHREALARAGVEVPATGTKGHRRPPYNLVRELLGDPGFDPSLGTWDELTRELRGTEAPVALVSCENLAHVLRSPEALERLVGHAKEAGRSLTILAVVREPIGWLNSTYQQNVRDFAVTESFDGFRRRLVAEGALDPGAQFEAVSAHPAIELVAVPYGQVRAQAPLAMLASALGLDAGGLAGLEEVAGRENVSVGPLTVEVARLVGRALRAEDPAFSDRHPRYKPLRRTFRELADEAGWNTEAFWGWTDAALEETWGALQPALDAFASRVWGGPWPNAPARGRPTRTADLADLAPEQAAAVLRVLARVQELRTTPEASAEETARSWWRGRR